MSSQRELSESVTEMGRFSECAALPGQTPLDGAGGHMARRFEGQGGMSLVEVTIILLVLMLLTGVLAPSMMDFVNDAKAVKVKEDCEVIGINVMRIARDVGPCLKLNAATRCTKSNRVDILVSDGPDVGFQDLTGDGGVLYSQAGPNISTSNLRWEQDDGSQADTMVDQWVTNIPNYGPPNQDSHKNPKPSFNLGWRGAYIQSPIGPDPWGHRYVVNTVFLAVADDATDSANDGSLDKGWNRDVFCLSAGSNGLYETWFGGSNNLGILRGRDDEAYPISGGSR